MLGAKRRSSRRRPTRFLAPMVVLAMALASGTLMAGPASGPATIKGKVVGWEKLLSQLYVEAAKADAHRFTWREPSPTVKQDFRRLSPNPTRDVCVVAIGGAGAQAHESQKAVVTGGRVTPSTVVL